MSKLDISLVVPCFNEEEAIPVFCEEAIKICGTINRAFEIIFVDDGSRDNTLKILQKFADQDIRIHYISFSRNFGKEAALLDSMTYFIFFKIYLV